MNVDYEKFAQLINGYSQQQQSKVISDVSAVETLLFFQLLLKYSSYIGVFSGSFSVLSKDFWSKIQEELNEEVVVNQLKSEFVNSLTNFFSQESHRLVMIINNQERSVLTKFLDDSFMGIVTLEEHFQITRLIPELNLLNRFGDFFVAEDCLLLYSQQVEGNEEKAFLAFQAEDLCQQAGEVFQKLLKLSVGLDGGIKDLTKDIAKDI